MKLFKSLLLGLCFFGVVANAADVQKTFALATSSNTTVYPGESLRVDTSALSTFDKYDIKCIFHTNINPRYTIGMHVDYDSWSPGASAALNGTELPDDIGYMISGVNVVEFFNVNARNGNLYIGNDGAAAGDDTITLMGKCMATYH